jgi:hypothetical protein
VQKAYGISGAVCIPNPVIMKPTRAKPRSAVARNPRLLWVGRLDDMTKQISELPLILEALVKVLPNLHLDIVGPKGPFTPENFESKFYRRGLESNVTFHGPKTPLELPEYYRKSDLFIFTSITEGSPNVLLEASAYGLPIVMYELPWLPIAQNNLGCIQVPQRDYEAFSQSVVKLVRDSVAYTASSQAALAKVEQLKQTDITQMLLDLVHGQISAPAFTAKERTDYAKIIARFIFYNTSRISDIKLQRQRQFDAKHISILGNQAQAIEGLIYSMGNVELDKLRLQRQFSPLRKLRSRLGRIKREILAKIAN